MNRLLLGLSAWVFAASAWAQPPVYTGWFSDTAIKGYDPVAYFRLGEARQGDKAFAYNWNDADWHFISAEHRDLFAAEPERYAPRYGGYCAYAMAAYDDLVKVDPKAWSIVDGQLFLNYSQSVKADWEARRDDYIQQADKNWAKHLQP